MFVEQSQKAEIEVMKNQICNHFYSGELSEAEKLLSIAHSHNFDDKGIQVAINACGFWNQRVQDISNITKDGARGDFFRCQWDVFENHFEKRRAYSLDEDFASLKFWVHNEALNYYQAQTKATGDQESLLRASSCLKILGRFDEAIKNLEHLLGVSNTIRIQCMAELADTYALIGELTAGKALMREALFLDASQVEVNHLIAPVFKALIERLKKELPEDSEVFNYWVPVYGVIWGNLDVKRELSDIEYEGLKKMIHSHACEIADGDRNGRLTPVLINEYFRLADHYEISGANRSRIEEAFMQIRLFAPDFCQKYF